MRHLKWITGAIAGATIGFGYWYFIGCNSGACAITSSPINSTIYGGLMGLLLVNSFSRNTVTPATLTLTRVRTISSSAGAEVGARRHAALCRNKGLTSTT